MSRVKKSMKQKMAAFLAVCMTAGSLPTGMVTAAETRERPEDANLAEIIEFDPVKLKDAMEKAVESDKMVTPPTVVASSSEISGFYGAVYELKDAETLLAADAAMPAQTDVRIFLSPQSEGFGEDGKYELTGTEGMVFMIENQGNEDQGYQLLFGNKITDVIEVESKERLLEAYYNPEDLDTATEAEAETVPETTAPAADNAAESGTGETAGETEGSGEVPGTEAPETDPVATESETQTVAEVSILDRLLGTLVAYGAEPTATDSENEAFDKTDDGDQPAEPENGSDLPAGETPAESQESTEGETAVTDPATAETEEETEAAEEDKTPEPEEEEEGPRFTAVDDRGYVRLTSGQVSASVLVVKSSFDKIDVEEGMSEPMGVEVTTTRRMAKMANAANGISLMNADDETEAVDDNKLAAVAFYETNAADLLARAGGEGESPFTVNLYDYSGKNQSQTAINNYLSRNGYGIRFHSDEGPRYNYWEKNEGDGKGTTKTNIYQGIPDLERGLPSTSETNKHNLKNALFPDSQGNRQENQIEVYPNVNVDDFFSYDENTGTYSYDSSAHSARYYENSNVLKNENYAMGFWPFNTQDQIDYKEDGKFYTGENWFFGMSIAFDFYKPEGGLYNGQEMTFSFSGDDDVWVYLTNEKGDRRLVLDLGGIHGAVDGTINFASGVVSYSNQNSRSDERFDGSRVFPVIFGKDSECNTQGWGNDRYSTYSTDDWKEFLQNSENFTLEFYYLERGGSASNCKLNFNLPTIPKQGIAIQKQLQGNYTDADLNNSYSFNVVYADELNDLIKYRNGQTVDEDSVESTLYTITGTSRITVEDVLEGQYFYIEEEKTGTTTEVLWNVGNSGSQQIAPENGAAETVERNGYICSPIYRMPKEDTGFLFTCTNRIGEMAPTYNKRAWKDYTLDNKGVYDITLDVTGAQMDSTSTTEGTTPIDLVVVLDKSGSMDEDEWVGREHINLFDTVRDAISGYQEDGEYQDIISKLPAGSHLNVVSFSDGNSWTKKTYDSVINDESITYYQTSDWYSIPENKDQVRKSISTYLDRLEASGGTHTAGGLVGANVVLRNDEISSSGNPKVVLLMTDGGATYARDGRGNSIGNGSNQYNTAVQKATEDQLSKLKESQQNLKIYAVGYQTDSTVLDWLDPKQNNHVTEQLVEAENISDLINTMTQFVSSATSTTKLQNVVVTDQLNMNYVELEDVTFNEEIFKAPELYLKDGMIDGTDENDHKFIAENEKGTKLAITGYDDRIVTYDNGTATYDTTTNTITWNVADSMGSDTTKTLTYRVTAKWSEDTKSTGDSDTGTHSREEGYRSNVEATISYNDGAGTKEGTFKHPVVVPIVPRESLTIHKIVKMMDSSDDIPQDIKFKFEVCFNNGDKLNPTFQDEKVNWNEEKGVYEFELANAEQIIFQDIPINASYTISEIDIDEIGDDYVVTKVDAKNGDMGETIGSTGEGVYPDSFKVEQDILNSTRVTFINTLGQYKYITLNKNVVGSDEDKAKEFTFQVTDEENQPYGKNNGVYTLSDNDSALIKIQPEDADKTFIITETDSKDAWKTTVAKNDNTAKEGSSITAVAGNAVTFTNYYYDHSITLKKEIEGEELEPEVNYPFTIQFAVEPGKTLSAEDLTLKNSLGEKVDGWTLQGNTLTITLKKDESITISELPQYVTAYTITEGETTLAGNSYKVVLDHITVNGENADKVENVELDPDKDQNDTITFTNRYDYLYGYLKIDKVISDGSNTDSVFTFKVTNQDTKDVFYTTVDGDGETTLYVPLGKYTVEEVDSTVRYEKTSTVYEGDGDCAIVDADNVSEETPATVIVTNENTGHNYFSDVDTIVNTVENGNFKTTPTNVSSLDGYSSIAASTQTALEMNAGAYLLPNNKIRMQPNNGDEMIQPA